MSRPTIGADLVVAVVLAFVTGSAVATNDFGVQVKCCKNNFVLSDDLTKCVESATGELDMIGYQKILQEFDLVTNDSTHEKYLTCFSGTEKKKLAEYDRFCRRAMTNRFFFFLYGATVTTLLLSLICFDYWRD